MGSGEDEVDLIIEILIHKPFGLIDWKNLSGKFKIQSILKILKAV
jgi:hypothetical protein